MAELAGKTNVVYILTGDTKMSGSTGAKVLGTDNSSYQTLCEILDITAFGDLYKNRLAGLKDTQITLSGNYYPGDTTGQDELVPGDTVWCGVYPQGTAVAGLQCKCIVESFEINADSNGKQTYSASLMGIAAPEELPAQS